VRCTLTSCMSLWEGLGLGLGLGLELELELEWLLL
jgi:hypothetical protein